MAHQARSPRRLLPQSTIENFVCAVYGGCFPSPTGNQPIIEHRATGCAQIRVSTRHTDVPYPISYPCEPACRQEMGQIGLIPLWGKAKKEQTVP